jgi:O-antigen/teichoic acid export membrane protein
MTVLLGAQAAVALVAVACCAVPLVRSHAAVAPTRAQVLAMARASREVGVLAAVGVVYQRMAMLGVAVLVGPTANGWYSGAARIVEASKTGHIALATAAYPVMAESTRGDAGADLGLMLRRARLTNFVFALAVAGGLAVAGRMLVDRLYGSAFAESKHALTILAVGLVASCVATFESLAMLAEHREREVLRVMGACLAVLLGCLIVMVAAFGWIGACWAMLVADVTQASLLMKRRGRR